MSPNEVKDMAVLVLRKLQVERKTGAVTPQNPITGQVIIDAYNKRFDTDFRTQDLSVAVAHAREVMRVPIGSSTKGYYFCTSEAEYDEFYEREMARIRNQRAAILGPKMKFRTQAQLELLEKNFDKMEMVI